MELRRTQYRRRRYRRRLQKSSRGVVSVVGTLLAMLVFFALFGVFLTQYLPLWMTDNESQLSVQMQSSLAGLKSNVDLQTALNGPAVYSSPFVTSSQGIPILAQPTTAIVSFIPASSGIFATVTMNPGPGNFGLYTQNITLGTLAVTLPDRYYSPQAFSFENDAVIQSQGGAQQVVVFPPSFALNQTGTTIGVTVSLVQLVGQATQTVQGGSQEVFSHFVFAQTVQSTSAAGTLTATYTVGTNYPCAWSTFLKNTILQSGVTFSGSSSYAVTTPATCPAGTPSPAAVKVQFTNISSITLVLSEVKLVVGIGVE